MATLYTSLLGLALPTTGELSGTWGTTVNDSITSLLDSAVAGTSTINADTTLSTTDGAANQARAAVILCSGLAANITITAPAHSKTYLVINASTTYSVTFKATGQAGFVIYPGTNVTVAYNGTDFIAVGGYLGIPQNAQTGNYTLVLADAGRHIYHASGAGVATYTIPANASVAFPIGTAVQFVNLSSSVVTIANNDTMYYALYGTTGSRSLAQYGVANALKVASTTWIITGTALS
jgi:hypothetical protein